tara:strand:+ start:332 stop:598 length:267 start_codon:yes stop_codon:yes gene_type:complete
MKNKSISKVVMDVLKHIKDEGKEIDKGKFKYDRMNWMRQNISDQERDHYEFGLENIRVLIYQLHFFGRNILMNKDGKEIINPNLIKES